MSSFWSGGGCRCQIKAPENGRRPSPAACKQFTQSPPNRRIFSLRPPPARRRRHAEPISFSFLLTTLLLFIFCSAPVNAFDRFRYEERRPQVEGRTNEIIFDISPMPEPPLFKRQFDPGSRSSESSTSQDSTIAAPSSTATSSSSDDATTTGGIISAQPTGDTLPKAFDGGLGTNYTQPSCVTFLKDMIRNDTVNSCLPVSLFLQNSQSFFQASRSPQTLDPVLSASCNVVVASCSAVMSNWALRMRSSAACSQDYDRQQPTVRQAYNGLISYDVIYKAMCAKAEPTAANNKSSDFCYTNAVTNETSSTDPYPYYLPLGVSLPAGSMPTCSKCLQDLMGDFAGVARNRSSPLSLTYVDAAVQVNLRCGPGFVNQTIAGAKGSGGSGLAASVPSVGVIALTTVMLVVGEVVGLL